MRVDPGVIPMVEEYLDITSWSIPPTCIHFVFRFLCEGTAHSRPMMLVQIFLLPVAIALNWILIFGQFEIPAMGVGGAALAATIYLTVTAICMVVYVLKTARYRPLNLLRNFPSPDIAVIRGIIQLSLPIAVTMLMDAGFFTVIALLMGQLGRVGLAAHQIVINYSTLVFMIPVGLRVRSWCESVSPWDVGKWNK
jgi:MATE family multidrug resistance protein